MCVRVFPLPSLPPCESGANAAAIRCLHRVEPTATGALTHDVIGNKEGYQPREGDAEKRMLLKLIGLSFRSGVRYGGKGDYIFAERTQDVIENKRRRKRLPTMLMKTQGI
jgi:hypothetical protein